MLKLIPGIFPKVYSNLDIVNKKGQTDLFAISRFECTFEKMPGIIVVSSEYMGRVIC